MFIDSERQEGRERERAKHRCENETWIGYLPYEPQVGIKPAT